MALSTTTTIYAGGAQTFTVNFALGFIQRSDVKVRVNGAVDGSGDPAYTAFTWIDNSAISVTPTLTIGDSVQLVRTVSKTELKVNFSNNTDVTPANLDLSAKHGLMVYQELVDGRVEGAESPADAADRAAASAAAALVSLGLLDSEAADAAASAAAAAASAALLNIDQGVSTTDSPTFVAGAFTGDVTIGDDLFITGPDPLIKLTDNDAADEWSTLSNVSGNTYYNARNGDDNGQHVFYQRDATGLTEAMRINAASNLGIGTNFPSERLHVSGNAQVSGTIRAVGNIVSGNGGGVALVTNDGQANAAVTFNHADGIPDQLGNGGRIVVNTDATSAPKMSFEIGSAVTSGVLYNTTEKFSIEDAGVTVAGTVTSDTGLIVGVGVAAGAVGSYVWASTIPSNQAAIQFTFGTTYAGTDLYPAGFTTSTSSSHNSTSQRYEASASVSVMDLNVDALSGTWRCMGQTSPSTTFDEQPVALFLRIS